LASRQEIARAKEPQKSSFHDHPPNSRPTLIAADNISASTSNLRRVARPPSGHHVPVVDRLALNRQSPFRRTAKRCGRFQGLCSRRAAKIAPVSDSPVRSMDCHRSGNEPLLEFLSETPPDRLSHSPRHVDSGGQNSRPSRCSVLAGAFDAKFVHNWRTTIGVEAMKTRTP
jgi:hypothetical protein